MSCLWILLCLLSSVTNSADEFRPGVCKQFGVEGDTCTQLDDLADKEIIAACPCQSFLKCSRTNVDVNGAYGKCL